MIWGYGLPRALGLCWRSIWHAREDAGLRGTARFAAIALFPTPVICGTHGGIEVDSAIYNPPAPPPAASQVKRKPREARSAGLHSPHAVCTAHAAPNTKHSFPMPCFTHLGNFSHLHISANYHTNVQLQLWIPDGGLQRGLPHVSV